MSVAGDLVERKSDGDTVSRSRWRTSIDVPFVSMDANTSVAAEKEKRATGS
jgi:hypothetical protein